MDLMKKYLCRFRVFVFMLVSIIAYCGAGKMKVDAEESAYNGLIQEDGIFRLYIEGIKNTEYSGLFQYDGAWFMLTEGVVDTSLRGMVEYDNALFYVAEGRMVSEHSGLVQDGTDWYYIGAGKVQEVSQLVQYDNEWFVVKDGRLDVEFNGVYPYSGANFFVAAGMLDDSVRGLQCCGDAWYYFADGQVTDYTGLVEYDGVWFYVEAGKLAVAYSGVVEYNGAYFRVANGQVVAEEFATDYGDDLIGGILNQIIRPGMSEFEKVKAIHDYMVVYIDYDYENYQNDTIPGTSRTVEGVLSTGYSVCEGYARVFEELCDRAAIECVYVRGVAGGAHAWNQVKVDGNWYNIDVTWDDPVDSNKEFDDHRYNNYNYFLLSDADMYMDHTAYNAQYECTTPSVAAKAFDYGCPWETDLAFVEFVDNDEDMKAILEKALTSQVAEFGLVIDSQIYPRNILSEKIKQALVSLGYERYAISRNVGYGSRYVKWVCAVDTERAARREIIGTEQEAKDYIMKLAEDGINYQVDVYFTFNEIDCAAIEEWAFLNGVEVAVYCGEEWAPGYYNGLFSIRNYGYEVFTTTEQITAGIEAAYASGVEEYNFLYDFRGTGKTHRDAVYEIIYATPEGYTNAHSVLNENYEGLMLYRCYFRY